MKKIVAIALLVAGSITANATDLSDQDINLMTASAKGVDVYKKTGIGGLYGAVNECYEKLGKPQKPQGKAVEFCIALDASGIFIDDGMARASGFPRDQRFLDAEASSRMHAVLTKSGISKSFSDTQAYLGVRMARVQRYTNLALR